MPQVVKDQKSPLHAEITITLDKSDYESDFKKELGKYRKDAHMKGFRKGKTPMSVVKKLYGKSVLAEVVNRKLQNELFGYIREEKLNYLGSPLPAEDQEHVEFDVRQMQPYSVTFELGLAPKFEFKGLEEDKRFELVIPAITDEMIEEELELGRRRHGEQFATEEPIEDGDVVRFHAVELKDGKAAEGGVENEFSVALSSLKEKWATALTGKKKGDAMPIDLFDLEENSSEKVVRKYYLELDEDDEREINSEFECTIAEVTRLKLAEFDQAFFDKMFGLEQVSSLEEAREKLREQIQDHYRKQAEALLYRDLQDYLMDANPMELPDAFLKRYLEMSREDQKPENIEAEYPTFSRNLKWTLIRNKLIEQYDLQVTEDEVRQRMAQQIAGYFGGQFDQNLVNNMVDRFLEDEKQVDRIEEELIHDKLFETLQDAATVEDKEVPMDEFQERVSKAEASAQAARAGEEE